MIANMYRMWKFEKENRNWINFLEAKTWYSQIKSDFYTMPETLKSNETDDLPNGYRNVCGNNGFIDTEVIIF